jgi:hypothetical protein
MKTRNTNGLLIIMDIRTILPGILSVHRNSVFVDNILFVESLDEISDNTSGPENMVALDAFAIVEGSTETIVHSVRGRQYAHTLDTMLVYMPSK